MNKDKFIDEVLMFDGELEIYIETDKDNYLIFENGDEGIYSCSWLGNIIYNDLESLANDLYDKIETFQEKIISVDNE
ncbi:hypothetical protein DVV91_17040 [Clostridium botulinum]|uniref:hypothetical protein n=1 Tax=Clostridium botulinum TaxID=1491 RepID=UPI0019674DD6|nr:hypothetical protein [Clostridium botulinum]MBN1076029.1 hypothetical protein [Clostridium botulinum]